MSINRRRFITTGAGALAGAALWGCGRDNASPVVPSVSSNTYVFRNGVIVADLSREDLTEEKVLHSSFKESA